MSLNAKTNGSGFEKHPTGNFAARCYQVIDLGTHPNVQYGGSQHRVRIVFESSEPMKDGRPYSIGASYTLSIHEKARLRKDLESWYGKKFDSDEIDKAGGLDLRKLIGRPALINVVHDGEYANIGSIGPLPRGMTCPDAVNETLVFDISEWSEEVFKRLGKKTQEMIQKSEERSGVPDDKPQPENQNQEREPDFNDSDVPF